MIIYQIKLPKNEDAEVFVRFMRDEYFPAVHKGPTRVGQVTDLTLLQLENETEGDDAEHAFFWHVGWGGLSSGKARVDDEEVARKFEAFKADIKRIGICRVVASWPNAE